MVFPLYDDNTDRRSWPVVNGAFIVINFLVFIFPQQMDEVGNRFTYAFSSVPQEIVRGEDITTPDRVVHHPVTKKAIRVPGLQPTPGSVYVTLLTSMFMHGSWMHLLGNMLFLWIFGDNVEDALGRLRYFFFYLISGLAATMAHVATTYAFDQDPLVPSLGASGAISGVLGGYLVLFPQRRVTVLMFRFLTDVPAFVAIGLWFVFQIVEGVGALGSRGGGVAYGAHIGGFVFGLAVVKLFALGASPPIHPWLTPRDWPRNRRPFR